MKDFMNETPLATKAVTDQTQKESQGLTLHSKGPWQVCGANNERCRCGQIWSIPEDGPVAEVTIGKWGDNFASLRFVNGDSEGSIGAKVEAYEDQITYGEVSDELAFANAHLIAAAPELLEALHCAVSALKARDGIGMSEDGAAASWEAYQSSPEMKQINAAIKKATSVGRGADLDTVSSNPESLEASRPDRAAEKEI